jgi:antitoxin CptB
MDPDRTLDRLRWRARRGMKELDVLLARLLDARGGAADAAQLDVFERLLAREDTEIWPWMLGRAVPEDAELKVLVGQIRATDRA